MRKPVKNVGTSIRQRLFNLSRETGQSFDLLLTRYAIERLLFRLSRSAYRNQFVLKGAMLITTWLGDPHRPTRDLDLLGFGDSDPDKLLAVFRDICAIRADHGVIFDVDSPQIDRIRHEQAYGGLRLKAMTGVGGARIRVVVDVGFGDAIEPGLVELDLPVLLDQPRPRLHAYARETVVAEKFHAMVTLGRANSRMKDIYDIWLLARSYPFEGDRPARAIVATFSRRQTPIPGELPDSLTNAFAEDPVKIAQWTSFVKAVAHDPGPLSQVIHDLAAFVMPRAAEAGELVTKSGPRMP
jgi:predicted nucleotidyltransferase component of viral defense system